MVRCTMHCRKDSPYRILTSLVVATVPHDIWWIQDQANSSLPNRDRKIHYATTTVCLVRIKVGPGFNTCCLCHHWAPWPKQAAHHKFCFIFYFTRICIPYVYAPFNRTRSTIEAGNKYIVKAVSLWLENYCKY